MSIAAPANASRKSLTVPILFFCHFVINRHAGDAVQKFLKNFLQLLGLMA
jgi:hypothetical protein